MQAMHSALIDELNARYPKEKPTLGLPKRHARFGLSDRAQACVWWEVAMDGAKGLFALGYAGDQDARDVESIGEAVASRAHREFQRRGIQPTVGRSATLADFGRAPAVGMMIVFPIEIAAKKATWIFDLGVGI